MFQHYNLKGLLIGNGWIDPMAGYKSYLPFAVDIGLFEERSMQYREVEQVQQACLQAQEHRGVSIHIPECEGILNKVFEVTLKKAADGTNQCLNGYDYSLYDTYPSCGMNWPRELVYVQPYLRRKDVLDAIHALDKIQGWTECNGVVGSAFNAHNSPPSSTLFPVLLEQVPILLFSGDRDIICNHRSTETFIDGLTWNGAQGLGDTEREEWVFQNADAGYYQQARNLTYVLFYNASHMVPYDFSRRTRDMLDRFMGINLSSIGGEGTESTIGGSKPDTPTSFEDATSDAADEIEDKNTPLEKYKQYYRAGTVALIVVILAVCCLVWFIWKHKGSIRRRSGFDKLGLQETGNATETELEELVITVDVFCFSTLMLVDIENAFI